MKIQQEALPYRPITIKLEKQSEALAFYGLMRKLEDSLLNDDQKLLLHQILNSYSHGVTI